MLYDNAGVTPAAPPVTCRAGDAPVPVRGPAGDIPGIAALPAGPTPRVEGKFIRVGPETLWVRGVTYGTFRPGPEGEPFPAPEVVERDFRAMSAHGLNAVRTYTVPPRWLLDGAARHGLRLMIGVPWEQHVAFLDDRRRCREIERRVRAGVAACASHTAVLAYAVGNEIPASIVRFHGRRRIERFIRRLWETARAADPRRPATYVNYPSTEYLDLPFLDLCCFNVFLEDRGRFESYLARLQNVADGRPLVVTELGLDSRRAGLQAQADSVAWQLRSSFAAGCAGAFAFAWTDEWHRGGHDVDDWDFGLTTRERRPKPALAAVAAAAAEAPFPGAQAWPRVSVVVCTYNGSRTLAGTLDGLQRLEYPDCEVIVVNDGSTDATEAIARRYPFRLISTANRGLSSARNTGWQAATGEIVAYIDDDAHPDPHWLTYLARTLAASGHAAAGGPNLAPPGDGLVADCVAEAPGGPTHILLSDCEAEHVPGCNMAFRRDALAAVGGFDERFRVAGDDVDICWAVRQRGWTIGFSPAAFVWHRRRPSVLTYWKQQRGYGRAEALLEEKWPERYNAFGHVNWSGRIYGGGRSRPLLGGGERVSHGMWGTALFQSLYDATPGEISSLPLMPEWFILIGLCAALSLLGLLWRPLLAAAVPFAVAGAVTAAQAVHGALHAARRRPAATRRERWRRTALTAWLFWTQPQARLIGRLRAGLTPFRHWRYRGFLVPRPLRLDLWSERWEEPSSRLERVESSLRALRVGVLRGGEFDRWDLEVRGGMFGGARTLAGVEEHGAGRQMTRFQVRPRVSPPAFAAAGLFGLLSVLAALDRSPAASAALAALALLPPVIAVRESGRAMAALRAAIAGCAPAAPGAG